MRGVSGLELVVLRIHAEDGDMDEDDFPGCCKVIDELAARGLLTVSEWVVESESDDYMTRNVNITTLGRIVLAASLE